ncbi:hypothetical protein AAP_03302 [Ascosphaera apis ARSEF 7405]|uniref:Uncharacterized protein n=1 Tax=Ascosphaera apis ARSEF 7405 TaxID=392613 RepID=A0A167YPG7_9EURO|nr:hypothetical protein AAP_03302 [Ascosphaera apis ARSEF 7405]
MSTHLDPENPNDDKLPKKVVLRLIQPDDVYIEEVPLVDKITREIIFWTWGRICFIQNVYIANFVPCYSPHLIRHAYVAHVSAKSPANPCSNCAKGPTHFTECRINAIWPYEAACTSCARTGKEGSCSLKEDPTIRETLFPDILSAIRTRDIAMKPIQEKLWENVQKCSSLERYEEEVNKIETRLSEVANQVRDLIKQKREAWNKDRLVLEEELIYMMCGRQ